MIQVKMTVNGKEKSGEVEGRTLLASFLRDTLGLTGTHVGCDTGQCGACTVHVDGVAVKSCNMLAAEADGASVDTIEGQAAPDGTLVAESLARAEGLVRWPAEGPGGFGYDPLFFHPPGGCRFSELSQDAKGAVSHRGQALRALARLLEGTPDPRLDP